MGNSKTDSKTATTERTRRIPWNEGFDKRLRALIMAKYAVHPSKAVPATLGWTDVSGLAAACDIGTSSMLKVANGESQPTIESFARLVEALELGPAAALALLGLEVDATGKLTRSSAKRGSASAGRAA